MDIRGIVELLDNSQDAETIALEIVSHEILDIAITDLVYCEGWASVDDDIGFIIRELWDIAYSHGYYDGKIEAEKGIV